MDTETPVEEKVVKQKVLWCSYENPHKPTVRTKGKLVGQVVDSYFHPRHSRRGTSDLKVFIDRVKNAVEHTGADILVTNFSNPVLGALQKELGSIVVEL